MSRWTDKMARWTDKMARWTDKMARWTDKMTGPNARKAALAGYVMCLVGLIGGFIWVSLQQVEYAAYLKGNRPMEVGRPNAMRAMMLEAPSGLPMSGAHVEVSLVEPAAQSRRQPAGGRAETSKEAIAGGIVPPSGPLHLGNERAYIKPGEYELNLRATGPRGAVFETDGRANAAVSVRPSAAPEQYWPSRSERLGPDDERRHNEAVTDSTGPVRIDILPADGRVSRGLPGEVYVRTTDRKSGAPVAADVHVAISDGQIVGKLADRVHTDRLGLGRLAVTAVTDQVWEVSTRTDAGPSSATLHLTTVPTQVGLTMQQVTAVAGESIHAEVDSLFRDGQIMVDLYNADDWIYAAAADVGANKTQIDVDVPRMRAPHILYRVQVYRSPYDAGRVWDSAWVLAADSRRPRDLRRAAGLLAAYLVDHTDDPYFVYLANEFAPSTQAPQPGHAAEQAGVEQAGVEHWRRWIGAMLEAVPRHMTRATTLINSQAADRKALAGWKADVKADLMVLTAVALLIGLAVVGYFVIVGIRRSRAHDRHLRDVELELDAHGDADGSVDRAVFAPKWTNGLQIVIVVGTLVFFVLSILLLLSHL